MAIRRMKRLLKRAQNKMVAFEAELDLTAAGGAGGDDSLPTFSMRAYTGGTMMIAGFYRPIVVDLKGMRTPGRQFPVLRQHDQGTIIGHTTEIELGEDYIAAKGVVSGANAAAAEVAASGKNGFPWQASIGAKIEQIEVIGERAYVEVNGNRFRGPVLVARKTELKEISFVAVGADARTSARISAQAQTQECLTMEFAKWLEAKGFDIDALEDEQKTSLKAMYDAELAASAAGGGDGDNGNGDAGDGNGDGGNAGEGAGDDGGEPSPAEDMRIEAAAEAKRIGDINRICHAHPEIQVKALADGWDATKAELEVMRAARPAAPNVATPTQLRTPEVFEAVSLMASGLQDKRLQALYQPKVLEAADKLRGIGFQEMCELACGTHLPRFKREPQGWLQAAFSTVTLPGILGNTANKMLLEGYNSVEDTWRQVAKIASVNDFKEHTRYRMGADFIFTKVGPDGELKHGALSEQSFTNQADTYGIMFSLSRQMIINDDLGAFAEIPQQIGYGAGEAIALALWTLLLSNPSSFFASGNGNYAEGAATALSLASLSAAELLFLNQTKPNGRPLGVAAQKLVVPNALKPEAERLMKSLTVNELTAEDTPSPVANTHAGKWDVVPSSYLANSTITGYSALAWYLFADPNRLAALEVAFLNGLDRPTVEKADADFDTLGVQFRGYIDFGVKEQEHRAAVKMKGEA